jgi:hypothetical protein
MRRLALPIAAIATACTLGACGSSGQIPSYNASALQTDLAQVGTDVSLQDCNGTSTALSSLDSQLRQLPSSVDGSLRANLQEGISALRQAALSACRSSSTGTTGTTGTTGATGTTGTTAATGTTATTGTTGTTSGTGETATTTTSSSTTATTTVPTVTTPGGGTPAGNGNGNGDGNGNNGNGNSDGGLGGPGT